MRILILGQNHENLLKMLSRPEVQEAVTEQGYYIDFFEVLKSFGLLNTLRRIAAPVKKN